MHRVSAFALLRRADLVENDRRENAAPIQTLRLASGRVAFTRSTGRSSAISVAKMAMDVFGVKRPPIQPARRRRPAATVQQMTKVSVGNAPAGATGGRQMALTEMRV